MNRSRHIRDRSDEKYVRETDLQKEKTVWFSNSRKIKMSMEIIKIGEAVKKKVEEGSEAKKKESNAAESWKSL